MCGAIEGVVVGLTKTLLRQVRRESRQEERREIIEQLEKAGEVGAAEILRAESRRAVSGRVTRRGSYDDRRKARLLARVFG